MVEMIKQTHTLIYNIKTNPHAETGMGNYEVDMKCVRND